MKRKSYGKINLSLEVLNKRDDGFHNIDTIMQFVDVFDEIDIDTTNSNTIEIICDEEGFPKDETNLIYKGWEALKVFYEGNPGIRVKVIKNMPISAGMGGGSSNCACVMEALNELWELNLNKEKLQEISKDIGSDVPYFFEDRTLRATGRGFDFHDMIELVDIPILIINNGCKVSTPYVYSRVEMAKKRKMDDLVKSLNRGEIKKELFFNDMTKVSAEVCPEIQNIIDDMYKLDAKVSLMSGSGSTVFGIFDSYEECNNAYNLLRIKYRYAFNTRAIRREYEG